MKRSRFSEEQISGILKKTEASAIAGRTVLTSDGCRAGGNG